MHRLSRNLKILLLVSWIAPALAANGTLAGLALDGDGGRVERMQADVTLTESQTGNKVVGKLGVDGSYVVRDIPPGNYSVRVVVPSRLFDPYQRANVTIDSGKTTQLNLQIPWGMNLGTVGDDPLLQGADLRARTRNIEGPVLRLPDGRPDLSGVWTSIGNADPPAPMPMKPWAQKMADDLARIRQDNPGAYCLPQNAVPSMRDYPTRLVQAADRIIQITEDMDPGYRQIFMDGRAHPQPDQWNPAWYGHSVGQWEGDTLVVDTVGYNEITPGFGIHSDKLHTVERYTRLNHGRMQVVLVADDPEAWTGTFTRKWTMGLADDAEITEFVCAEGYPSKAMQRAPWKGRP